MKVKARQPNLGETRSDIYLRAHHENIPRASLVCFRPGECYARLMTKRRAKNPRYLIAVTVEPAKARQGVWARYQGSVDVRVVTTKGRTKAK
jgi:hypothetical protein